MKTCEFWNQPTNSSLYHDSHVICPDCLGKLKAEPIQAGWGFCTGWILANAAGMFLGFFVAFCLGAIIYPVYGDPAADVAIGLSIGAAVGVAQWLVLRLHVPRAAWWILTTVVAISGLLAGATGSFERGAVGIVAGCGAVTGTLQWLILRNKVTHAGWWIPASTAGWGLSLLVLNAKPFGGGDGAAALTLVSGLLLLGIITGGVLVWLLRQSSEMEAQRSRAAIKE